MAKTTQTRRKTAGVSVSKDERIRASMGKAIKEVRRHAAINKIKLAVADDKSWAVPK